MAAGPLRLVVEGKLTDAAEAALALLGSVGVEEA